MLTHYKCYQNILSTKEKKEKPNIILGNVYYNIRINMHPYNERHNYLHTN